MFDQHLEIFTKAVLELEPDFTFRDSHLGIMARHFILEEAVVFSFEVNHLRNVLSVFDIVDHRRTNVSLGKSPQEAANQLIRRAVQPILSCWRASALDRAAARDDEKTVRQFLQGLADLLPAREVGPSWMKGQVGAARIKVSAELGGLADITLTGLTRLQAEAVVRLLSTF